MSKKIILLIFIFIASGQVLFAQLPETSTPSAPIWYYIQVKGDGERADRILTVEGNDVYGDFMENIHSTENHDNRLWRFIKSGSKYVITSKTNNKRLGIRTASEIENNFQIATLASVATTWDFIAKGDYFQIKADDVFLHQANNGGNRNYVIMLVSSDYSTDNSSYFRFIKADATPEVSINTGEFYHITSAYPEYNNKCITDVNSTSSDVKFELKDIESDNQYQQWEIVRPINVTTNDVYFVNRMTKNIIQTEYKFNGYYCAQSTSEIENTNGWQLNYIYRSQFTISGTDNEGVKAYLNAASNQTDPELMTDYELNSTYSWTFKKVGTSSLETVTNDPFENVIIYTNDKRIIVQNAENYFITNSMGVRMPKEEQLPTGIYLVTIQNKSKAILVK